MYWSLNTVGLWPDKTLLEGAMAAKEAGFDRYERWTIAPEEREMILRAEGEGILLHACCPSCFTMNTTAIHKEYYQAVKDVLALLKGSSCRMLITQVGADDGRERGYQADDIVTGLKMVAPLLEDNGVTLVMEPLNDVKDHPGYYLTSSQEGVELAQRAESDSVKVLYDVYHQLHMGEDPIAEIRKNGQWFRHYHIAGFPRRDEALFEGWDHTELFSLLKDVDVSVGVELFPSAPDQVAPLLEKLRQF